MVQKSTSPRRVSCLLRCIDGIIVLPVVRRLVPYSHVLLLKLMDESDHHRQICSQKSSGFQFHLCNLRDAGERIQFNDPYSYLADVRQVRR
jgi:hypothetical protein